MKFPYNKALEIRQQYRQGKLTREQATGELGFILDLEDKTDMCRAAMPDPNDEYASSYGPLVRLSDVCNVLRLWARLLGKGNEEFYEMWERIDLMISKSNLLARLFFTQDGVRTQPCPEHRGRWSGCFGEGKDGPCGCQAGGNVTGWLPEPGDLCDRDHWDDATKAYRRD